jgi:hypothetical protein
MPEWANCEEQMNYFFSVLIGVLSSVVASLFVLGCHRWRVWWKARKIAGEWCAYRPTEDGGWSPMRDDKTKAGLTVIGKPSLWWGPVNHLRYEAKNIDIASEQPYPHSGEFLLDAPYCRHGIRTMQQNNPYPRHHVQEIWVLNKDVIRVASVSSDGPPSPIPVHLLVRKGSEEQSEFDKKRSGLPGAGTIEGER